MKLRAFATFEDFIHESVEYIANACRQKKGIIRVALSGGSTPKPVYEAFALLENILFERVEFFIMDERYVPLNHKDSNYRLIRESLLDPLKKKGKKFRNFHFFDTALSIDGALKKYEKELSGHWNFDLCVAGIGTDGHIASLFPRSSALREKKKLTAHTTTQQFAVRDRLTLTFPKILKSKKILVLLQGRAKQGIIKDLKDKGKSMIDMPAKKLLKYPSVDIYYFGAL
ncbi:6-phosphogluconolactonase [Candidatus Peregrinibacteria bacterium]|nr:6-phosphogluconolactonase [Candidatus Peregrinibacteria bacterium]